MRHTAWFALAVLVLAVSVRAERFALLVGNSAGQGQDQHLKYAGGDLERMRTVLTQLCGFAPTSVVTVQNGTVEDVWRHLSGIARTLGDSGAEHLFLFYYTGHADAEALRMGAERLNLQALRDSLSLLPARIRVAMFDACQSGSFTRLKGGALAEPFLFASDSKVEGFVALSSSSVNESAQESDAIRGSVFTFHFVNALRGSADASGDKRVTLNEAYQYSYNRTVAATMHSGGGVQHPSYRFELKGEGDIVLADLNVRTSGIVLSEDIEGAVIVVDGGRAVVADVEKARGSTVVVAVGPGKYDVTCRKEGTARGAAVEVAAQGVISIASKDLRQIGAGASTRAKGGEVPKDTYLGLTYSMGYAHTSFDQPNRQFAEEFAALSVVGLGVEPYLESSMLRGALGGEVWFNGRILANFEVCYAGGSAEGSARSSLVNPVDSIAYPYSLDWECSARLVTVAMGGGVRLWRGPLRRLGLRLGVDIQWVDIQLESTYEDGLYVLRETTRLQADGLVVLPSVGLSYSVPLGRFVDAGVLVRYALQVNAQELGGDGFESVAVDVGGIDARVFVSLDLGRGR